MAQEDAAGVEAFSDQPGGSTFNSAGARAEVAPRRDRLRRERQAALVDEAKLRQRRHRAASAGGPFGDRRGRRFASRTSSGFRAVCGELPFLLQDYGKPFASSASFGNKFADRYAAAALPPVVCDDGKVRNYRAHGLRKAALTELAYAGCTGPALMNVSGHSSLAQVQV